MNFELAVKAEIVTQHLLSEKKIKPTLPLEMYCQMGYDLMLQDPKKWNALLELYNFEIKMALKQGVGNRKNFKYKKLGKP